MKIRDEDVIPDEKYKCSPSTTDKGRPNNFSIWLRITKRGKAVINRNLIESTYENHYINQQSNEGVYKHLRISKN